MPGSFGNPAQAVQSDAAQRVATRDDIAAVAPGDRVVGLFNRGNLTVE